MIGVQVGEEDGVQAGEQPLSGLQLISELLRKGRHPHRFALVQAVDEQAAAPVKQKEAGVDGMVNVDLHGNTP